MIVECFDFLPKLMRAQIGQLLSDTTGFTAFYQQYRAIVFEMYRVKLVAIKLNAKSKKLETVMSELYNVYSELQEQVDGLIAFIEASTTRVDQMLSEEHPNINLINRLLEVARAAAEQRNRKHQAVTNAIDKLHDYHKQYSTLVEQCLQLQDYYNQLVDNKKQVEQRLTVARQQFVDMSSMLNSGCSMLFTRR